MCHRLPRNPVCGLLAILAMMLSAAAGQELREQPTPFSVWLDFKLLSRPGAPRPSLPIWLESVYTDRHPQKGAAPQTTIFRMRLRRMAHLNREVLLRVFFEDRANAVPTVSAWTETGAQRFISAPLGSGLGFQTSATVVVPVDGADCVEISVPGDGGNIRGAFLTSLTRSTAAAPFDFPLSDKPSDPFGAPLPAEPGENDSYLYGRVKAMIDPGPVKLDPSSEGTANFPFQLDRVPLLAVLTFEVLHAKIDAPPLVTINNRPLGAASPQLPDLADPAFRGEVRPLEQEMRFHYTGWLRCQVILPASALRAGLNHLNLSVNNQGGPVAVRAVELQLKHNWQNLDYTVTP